jgi:hypothetical protein
LFLSETAEIDENFIEDEASNTDIFSCRVRPDVYSE